MPASVQPEAMPERAPDDAIAAELQRLLGEVAAYLKPEEVARVEAAFEFAAAAHAGQTRVSGDAYISHPLAVCGILAGWHLDAQALMAALLHDVMEDTCVTKQELGERFGRTVAELVEGVSKLDKIEFRSQADAQAENFRRLLMAMAHDVRVMLIKMADRLHNLRTLDFVRADKRRRIARETTEIYVPIAIRLGLSSVSRELKDLCFRHLYPLRYRVLDKAIRAARGNRREVVGRIVSDLRGCLADSGLDAEVLGREKSLVSIYRKMQEKRLTFSQVLDIYGFRVLVRDVASCYVALGALHRLYKPVPGKFKDYIAIPKANGYQSLHTTLIGPFGTPVEMQIRTFEMNHIAECGVASHWLYKDSDGTLSELEQNTRRWLQSLVELQRTAADSGEFLEHVKIDLFPDEVYVFSPKGKIFVLPRGATAVDFAYAVHTDIGNRCVACRINHDLMPLRTELRNGDQVEIVTAAHDNPNPAWLSYVKTGKARAEIRHFLKTAQQEESVALGERLLAHALRPLNIAPAQIDENAWARFMFDTGTRSRREVLTDIGLGKRLAAIVARSLVANMGQGAAAEARSGGALMIRGSEGVAVQLARCCRPIPGDPILGILKKGQGLQIHTHDCPTIIKQRSERDKWIDVEWELDPGRLYDVAIRVVTSNRTGVLARVAAAIAEANSNIQNVTMDDERGMYTSIYFMLQVSDRVHLARVLRGVRRVPEVVRINRYKGDLPSRGA
ncbi:MAG: bifunctional (p)ppGpp synthetase/guanosine-3',5'-bis(diphosphate) 3'-pyrophosphohydrolase [Rhodocyclaceae bacterium]|nr:bifunctional (p)ppGpp synthetase/guanosine-3',5'-bis(diphosphate) 3'-pyrophosphohydrolase [Rhodocyclaceae bacterium]MBX3668489.1 bifunctional (p)ppGpp synthetase/guanosine-3',5'-bis(diphosphate) 3'-pyrophosphohydrolase [Rhodocyclaceae bacterium]